MVESEITVIGAGVVGLAITYLLSYLNKDTVVLEKNPSFGQETSSRNSEVIHSGLYYEPNSFKDKTCLRGKDILYKLCAKYGIPHKKLGKLIVATTSREIKRIEEISDNARQCGVKNLKFLNKKDIARLEPNIKAECAVFSPDSGIIDSHRLMNFFYGKAREQGVTFAFSTEVVDIKKRNCRYIIVVREPEGELFSFVSRIVINSAGVYSDRIAKMAGIDIGKHNYIIHYCKGHYFRIKNPAKFFINHLVYPPATETSLGIHITPDLAGGLRLGPDAKYVSEIDYSVESEERGEFYKSVKKILPLLELDDLIPDTAGIRPKLQREGEAFRDFVIRHEGDKDLPGFINLIGIESPGLTASLAIGEIVKGIVEGL